MSEENMSQPEAELEAQGGQPETEPSLLDIAGMMDQAEESQDGEQEQEVEQEESQGNEPGETEQEQQKEPEKPSEDDWKARKVKVTVQGEEHEITLEEATHGYMRDQDYRRKTAEVAQSTKALEQQRQYVETELVNQVNRLSALGFALQQELIGDQSQLKQLLESDPQEYLRVQARMNEKSAYLAQVMQAQQNVEAQKLRKAEEAKREAIENGSKILLEKIPEWRDESKRKAEQREIASALLESGYSEAELAELVDPRAVLIARDALLWRKQQAARAAQAKPAAKDPPKPVVPGSAAKPEKSAALKKAADNYRRNPNSLDALSALALEAGI